MNVETGPWERTRPGGSRADHPLPEDSVAVQVIAHVVVQRCDLDVVGTCVAGELRALSELPTGSNVEIHVESVPARSQPHVPRLRPVSEAASDRRLKILVPSRYVVCDGAELDLTRLEFDLLLFLCENPGRVHRRSALLREVWGIDESLSTRTVDVHIRRLRRKLGPGLDLITTVRGVGYRLGRDEEVAIEYGAGAGAGR